MAPLELHSASARAPLVAVHALTTRRFCAHWWPYRIFTKELLVSASVLKQASRFAKYFQLFESLGVERRTRDVVQEVL